MLQAYKTILTPLTTLLYLSTFYRHFSQQKYCAANIEVIKIAYSDYLLQDMTLEHKRQPTGDTDGVGGTFIGSKGFFCHGLKAEL